MSKPLIIITVALSMGFLYACTKPCVHEEQENGLEITLYQCKPVFSTSQVRICFDSLLSDSRCPANAVCVWQGFAAGKFSLSADGETYPFKLSTVDLPGLFPKDTVISGYKIEFINLSPYPGTVPGPIPDNVRKAELKVTKL